MKNNANENQIENFFRFANTYYLINSQWESKFIYLHYSYELRCYFETIFKEGRNLPGYIRTPLKINFGFRFTFYLRPFLRLSKLLNSLQTRKRVIKKKENPKNCLIIFKYFRKNFTVLWSSKHSDFT